MIDESNFDFDESTIICFERESNSIKIICENVTYNNEFQNAELILKNVKNISTEGDIISSSLMAAEDGEIICMELSKNKTRFTVKWNNFAEHISFTYGYLIDFDNYTIKLI